MDKADKIHELVAAWEQARAEGRSLRVEELCRDCPELADEVREYINALQWLPEVPGAGEEPGQEVPPLELPDKLGRYELKERLGAGGFGEVWKAWDPELQRSVALKVPRPERVRSPQEAERFLHEARRVAQLKHPGIVAVHDVGHEGAIYYIVSDLVEGESLAERIARGRVSCQEAAEIVAPVADALHFAHQQGFVHRDVKPANILLDRDDGVHLADFGIAATQQELAEGGSDGSGTLRYMSPEQAGAAGVGLDHRTDVYSLGVVLYELLTGRPPFEAADTIQLREQILAAAAPAPRQLDPAIPGPLERVCLRAMAPDPNDRFGTAGEMAEALRKAFRRSRPAGMVLGTAAIAVVALVATVTLMVGPGRDSVSPGPGPKAKAADLPNPALPPPVAQYRFADAASPTVNTGAMLPEYGITPRGEIQFADASSPYAPPAPLGGAAWLADGRTNEALFISKRFFDSSAWSISLCFLRAASRNEDFLVYLGRGDGDQSDGMMFGVWLDADGHLRVVNVPGGASGVWDIDLTVPDVAAGRWHHLAITFRGTKGPREAPGRLEVFLDGRSVGSAEQVDMSRIFSHTVTRMTFGGVYGPTVTTYDRALCGALAAIRVHNRGLTAEQVASVWQSVTNRNGAAQVIPPGVVAGEGSPFDEPASEEGPVDVAAILKKAVLRMSFDAETISDQAGKLIVKDLSDRGNDGVIFGAKPVTEGRVGGALEFDGTDDYVLLPSLRDGLITDLKALSVVVWARDTGTEAEGYLFDVGTAGSNSVSLFFERKQVGFNLARRFGGVAALTDRPKDDRWHHYAGVWDGREQRVYVDGQLMIRLPTRELVLNAESIHPVPARLGGLAKRILRQGRYFQGALDDLIVLPTALSTAEVQALHRLRAPAQ